MAVTAPHKQSDYSGFLHPSQSAPIFERAKRVSVVQQLAKQVTLGPTGQDIPVVTGRPQAYWVNEGAQKPSTSASMGLKNMSPKKLVIMFPASMEVVRTNPGGFMQEMYLQIGEAFADAFDAACFHGTNTPFSQNLDQTTKAVGLGTANAASGGTYTDLNAGLSLLVNDGKRLNGFAFDDRAEPILNASVDTQGRPLWLEAPYTDSAVVGTDGARRGRMLGRNAFVGERIGQVTPGTASTAYALGYGGDWTQVAWGQLGGIDYAVSREASVTINGQLVSAFENNLVIVRAETEYGFLVNDVAAFVKYTKTTPA